MASSGLPSKTIAAKLNLSDRTVSNHRAHVYGTGTPLIDSTVALAAAAGATTRVRLGFGVMILPLHPSSGSPSRSHRSSTCRAAG